MLSLVVSLCLVLLDDFHFLSEANFYPRLYTTCSVGHFVLQTSLVFPNKSTLQSNSLKSWHSSVSCPWSLWNLQYFSLFLASRLLFMGLGHLKAGSFFTYIKIWIEGITNGVKFANLPLLLFYGLYVNFPSFLHFGGSSFSFSLLRLFVIPLEAKTSSAFMYFCALNNKLAMVASGFFVIENRKSSDLILLGRL